MNEGAKKPARKALDTFAVGSFRVLSIAKSVFAGLSDSERDVVTLAVVGWSNREIAAHRDTSVRTVANQLASAYRKLGVGSRSELVARLQSMK